MTTTTHKLQVNRHTTMKIEQFTVHRKTVSRTVKGHILKMFCVETKESFIDISIIIEIHLNSYVLNVKNRETLRRKNSTKREIMENREMELWRNGEKKLGFGGSQ
jgi:hypothetical protein